MGPGSRPGNRTRVPEPGVKSQFPARRWGRVGRVGSAVARWYLSLPLGGAGGVTVAEAAELRRWLDSGANAVKRARGRLDAINVFPVADSDTGTNMYLTLREGNRAVG